MWPLQLRRLKFWGHQPPQLRRLAVSGNFKVFSGKEARDHPMLIGCGLAVFSYENPPSVFELPIVSTNLNYLLALSGLRHRRIWKEIKQETESPR